jgi:hypothetical protein
MCRQTINPQLYQMVAQALQASIGSEVAFTAYDITRLLRAFNPGLDVPHAAVRQVVHALMSEVTRAGYYEAAMCEFDSRQAVLYQPAAKVVPLDLPLLPLN